MNVGHLIVDSSAFIHHGPIRETGKNIYSCQEVLDEIKDKATLDSLKFLPYELKIIQFDKDDLDICVSFAKKTGDYHQLSLVDLKLIAATYRLEKLHNGLKYINKEPKQVSVKSLDTKLKKEEDSKVIEIPCGSDDDEDGDGEADDNDEDGWITPQNIDNVYKKMGYNKPQSFTVDPMMQDRVTVACMTSDFSIQNCLLQMGLLVVSPKDGLMIREAKKIVFRCHACFKIFHDPSKIKNNFCPHCGNLDTLKRVQYVIDKNGEKRVIINFKRPIKVKGTNQQLPRPRGGKHANNPILTADQRVYKDKTPKALRMARLGADVLEKIRAPTLDN